MAWSTARKNRARDNAARIGGLQNFIVGSRFFPASMVVGFVLVAGLLIGAIESIG